MSLLARCPVLPVVVLDDPGQALPLGEALLAGGVDVVEITLRTAAGLAGIRALTGLPGLHVGAGSVVVPRHVDEVVDAGARFVVSPGLSVSVLDRAAELDVPALPGVSGASDLMVATERGVTEVKFFPANLLGGVAGIRALAAPFPGMSFLPSGGVKPENMADYLALPCVPAVSGSWMVDPELLAAGRWDDVTARAADALRRARGAVPVG